MHPRSGKRRGIVIAIEETEIEVARTSFYSWGAVLHAQKM
jgi:hypothetical protein